MLLVRVEWVCECCISRRVCIIFALLCIFQLYPGCVVCIVTSDGGFVFVGGKYIYIYQLVYISSYCYNPLWYISFF